MSRPFGTVDPKNPFIIEKPRLLYAFDDRAAEDFEVRDGSLVDGTVNDSDRKLAGSKSIRVTADGTGSSMFRAIGGVVKGQPWNLSDESHIYVRTSYEGGTRGDDLGSNTGTRVLLGSDGGFTGRGSWANNYFGTQNNVHRPQWMIQPFDLSDFSVAFSSAVDLASVNYFLVYARTTFAPNDSDVTWDSLWTGGRAEKVITLRLDDTDSEQVQMIDDLAHYGWKATLNVNGGRLGLGGYMTRNEAINRILQSGYTNHTHDHDALVSGGGSLATVLADLEEQDVWFRENLGQEKVPKNITWTSGEYSQEMIDWAISKGYLAGAGALVGPNGTTIPGDSILFNWDEAPAYRWESTVINMNDTGAFDTAANIIAAIRECWDFGCVARTYTHGLGTGDSRLLDPAEWALLLPQLRQLEEEEGAIIMPDHEFMDIMSGARPARKQNPGGRRFNPMAFNPLMETEDAASRRLKALKL